MRILTNTTSPYARIARIALAEKGVDLGPTQIVDPWADDPALMALNPAVRVPTIETDSGLPLTESLLILLWLEKTRPTPSLLEGDSDRIVSHAGRAMGTIDAMVATVAGTLRSDPNFPNTKVGQKRRRTIVEGLRALPADPPAYAGATPDIAVITAVTALDYLRLRFADATWAEPLPALTALRDQLATRPSFAATAPRMS